MAVCFFINFFVVKPDPSEVLFGLFVPTIPSGSMDAFIGLIGAVIMPHNLYLHSALVQSRKINTNSKLAIKEANVYNAVESGISLGMSFLINFAVVGTFAYWHTTEGGEEITLSTASKALEAAFGKAAGIIWGIGLLAAGQSSTMAGTYAGQFVMEGFFEIKLPVWKRVLVTRIIAILPAISVAFVSDYDKFDNALNILQSIQLPFALIPLIIFTSNPKIMGEFANSMFVMYFATFMGFVLFVFNIIDLWPEESKIFII
jgi:natural resistance-associated macrophage protein